LSDRLLSNVEVKFTQKSLDVLLIFSPAAIPRKDREAILDRLSDMFGRDRESEIDDLGTMTKIIALMVRLFGAANPTAKVVSDSAFLGWDR